LILLFSSVLIKQTSNKEQLLPVVKKFLWNQNRKKMESDSIIVKKFIKHFKKTVADHNNPPSETKKRQLEVQMYGTYMRSTNSRENRGKK
jgi:hypothetical protein